jgi:hypothetical protein
MFRRRRNKLRSLEKRVDKLERKTATTIAIRNARKKRRELVWLKIIPAATGVALTIVVIAQALKWI